MPILDLNNLCVGDVILEPGKGTIAQLDPTGNRAFGHAKLVVCRLAFIHAPGPGKAARVEPFTVDTWTRPDEPPLVGVLLDGATVLRKRGLPPAKFLPEAQWEAGYAYASIKKLKQSLLDPGMETLQDTGLARRFFDRQSRNGVPASDEGRSCGELVANILLSGENTNITPNGLYRHSDLQEMPDLILNDSGWTRQGGHACNGGLVQLFTGYGQDTARRLWKQLEEFAATHPGEDAIEEFSAKLEIQLGDQLRKNISILMEADGIASRILPN